MSIVHWRYAAAVGLLACLAVAALHPLPTREAAEYAVSLWWNHLVPVMFPAYVLAQGFLVLAPRRQLWTLMVLAFLTFPPVVGVLLVKSRSSDVRASAPLLLYTNLYNPLFFPHPRFGLLLDGALLLSAVILAPPWRAVWPRAEAARGAITPRLWVIDSMNWTTIAGLTTLIAGLGHRWLHPLGVGWAIDPLGIHWSAGGVPIGATFFTAFGGLAYWAPLWLAAPRGGRWHWLGARFAQALLAAIMVAAAQHWGI
jgi:hypothetical protein